MGLPSKTYSTFLFPLGVLLQTVDAGAVPKLLGAASAAMVIFGMGAAAVGFARGEASEK